MPIQVQACVNSTNCELDLTRGALSQQILQQEGRSLQKACREYAPLLAGQVAVTSVSNMICQTILHVALPNFKTKRSERVSVCTCTVHLFFCMGIVHVRSCIYVCSGAFLCVFKLLCTCIVY